MKMVRIQDCIIRFLNRCLCKSMKSKWLIQSTSTNKSQDKAMAGRWDHPVTSPDTSSQTIRGVMEHICNEIFSTGLSVRYACVVSECSVVLTTACAELLCVESNMKCTHPNRAGDISKNMITIFHITLYRYLSQFSCIDCDRWFPHVW